MKKIDARKITILKIIVEEYIEFGGITGSKSLLKKYNIGVSSATIRNDMALLEKMGLIYQPYNSAGRLPTSSGMRVFVDYLIDHLPAHLLSVQDEKEPLGQTPLASLCRSLGVFAYIDEGGILEQSSGAGAFLDKNFHLGQKKLVEIFSLFENHSLLQSRVRHLDATKKIGVYFPDEHLISEFGDLVIIRKTLDGDSLGKSITIFGSTILDYSYMFALLRNPGISFDL